MNHTDDQYITIQKREVDLLWNKKYLTQFKVLYIVICTISAPVQMQRFGYDHIVHIVWDAKSPARVRELGTFSYLYFFLSHLGESPPEADAPWAQNPCLYYCEVFL
ncbi:MAG: hypothetical protein CO029_04715 [Candidatus Magasanikbacteria bacterium CG_4_9_14_0_2_um_filter_41_10]|nr:MAG: hypothetical protein CO029_04715 [Candidatus Magasanikbacteria bacterium CG_4_9_14_0_2_um_filter_41_10]